MPNAAIFNFEIGFLNHAFITEDGLMRYLLRVLSGKAEVVP